MSQSKQLEQKIAFVARQVDAGASAEEACRKTGISVQAYYLWRKKYGQLVPCEVLRLQSLEEENRQLKKMVADLSFTKQLLQASLQGNGGRS